MHWTEPATADDSHAELGRANRPGEPTSRRRRTFSQTIHPGFTRRREVAKEFRSSDMHVDSMISAALRFPRGEEKREATRRPAGAGPGIPEEARATIQRYLRVRLERRPNP